MAVPTEDKVDFRATCFCHKKIIDVGFICSICLSSRYLSLAQFSACIDYHLTVFCNPVPICTTCRLARRHVCFSGRFARGSHDSTRSKFPMASLRRLKEVLKPKHLAEAASTIDGASSAGGTPRSSADIGSPYTNGVPNGSSGGGGGSGGSKGPHGPSGLSIPWAPAP